MIGLGAFTSIGAGAVDAALLIGAVLVEAVVLDVGYGAVEQAFGQTVLDHIKRE